jgi:ribosomal protein L11 methyltransferase
VDYLEVALSVRPEAVEAATDILRRHARGGVSIEPDFTALDEEQSFTIDDEAPVRLRAWLAAVDGPAELDVIRRDLRALGDGIVEEPSARTVADESWSEAWKRFFPVLRVGKRIVVRPSWKKHRARKDDLVITLDPGMAFGTGQHETTRMCLAALEDGVEPKMRVLDVGCGSGILSIAAALLDAEGVDAIDIDVAAIDATCENAARNGVEAIVRAELGSLGGDWPFRHGARSGYEIIAANLSSRLVQELARNLLDALTPDGRALLSGFVAEQERECVEAVERAGGVIEDVVSDGEWRMIVVRPSPPTPLPGAGEGS